MRWFFLILAFLFFLIGMLISLRNLTPVNLDYLFGVLELPVAVALAVSLLIGGLIGFLASFGLVVRLRTRIARLRHEKELVEQEVSNLRKMPIKE